MTRCAISTAVSILILCAVLSPQDAIATPARLVGTLWWLSPHETEWSAEQWGKELENMRSLGMNVVVFNGPFLGADLAPDQADPLLPLFEEGERLGMRFYLDTLSAPNWWTLEDPAEELSRARARVELLEARYGRFKSFEGFYIPYELYVMWDDQKTLIQTLYREIALSCKAVAPARPVLISPFFILDQEGYLGDFRWATPEEYQAFWTETLGQAPIDTVALQDSGEHLSFYTIDQRRPFFAAMKAACEATGKTLWANVETGELHVSGFPQYVELFGAKTHVNDPRTGPHWRGVPADRLIEKLELAAEYSPTAITWGYREFIRPSLGEEAERLFLDYKRALRETHEGGKDDQTEGLP